MPGPFAEAERRRLTELRTTAAEERADLMLAQGQAAAAVPELTALAAEHPLRERAAGLLMIALYRCGRQAEALRVFRDARERLAEDLGIDPGAELTRIHQQLLAMDPALDGRPRPRRSAAVAIGSVGGRRLPSRAWPRRPRGRGRGRRRRRPRRARAAARRSCRPRWPASPAGRPSSTGCTGCCPGRTAPAAGAPEASPIALITGTAGVGKTTLAIRFARQAAPLFPDGQLYVNLRGFDPASAPMPPATALQWFFDALGVPAPARAVRPGRAERAAAHAARRQADAAAARQRARRRPGTAAAARQPGLHGAGHQQVAADRAGGGDGARPLPLDVLDAAEAAELVAGRLGARARGGASRPRWRRWSSAPPGCRSRSA